MGGQDKREQARERYKQNREQALKRVQQRKQQQQRTQQQRTQPRTQPAQPQQPQQPAPRTQPRMVIPEFTERANKLGDLIALYLKGDWDFNTGMQVARQYAPNGTTEAELRAAVIRAAQAQGKQGNLYIRMLVQPEVVHPQVNISDLPKQGTVQNVLRGLQAPYRMATAGATFLAGQLNPQGVYGRESGGQPFPAPQSFAESYASDPSYGSALELAFPDAPPWLRVLIGGALDFVLDPTNLVASGAATKFVVKPASQMLSKPASRIAKTKVGEKISRQVERVSQRVSQRAEQVSSKVARASQQVAQPLKRVAGAVGTRIMHPTAAKTAGEFARQLGMSKTQAQEFVARAGKLLEENPEFYSIPRTMGETMQALRNRLERIYNEARVYQPRLQEPANILDFRDWWNSVMEVAPVSVRDPQFSDASVRFLENITQNAEQYLDVLQNNIQGITNERVRNRLLRELENLKSDLEGIKPVWNRQAELLRQAVLFVGSTENGIQLLPAFQHAGLSVFNSEVKGADSVLRKAIDTWKRTKTVYNLGTHTRNFFQNFIFRYLTGDVDATDIFRVPSTINDMIRLRNLVEQNKPVPIDLDYQFLPEMDTMLNIQNVNRFFPHIQQTQGNVGRTGGFYYTLDTPIVVGTLQSEGGIPIRNLPRSWADVAARVLQINRVKQLVRDLSNPETRKQGIGRLIARAFIEAYNEGDRTPALLMEAIQRKKQFKKGLIVPPRYLDDEYVSAIARAILTMRERQNILDRLYYQSSPFRMDYSAVPETIGRLNIALLPFVNYQYFALRGLLKGLRRNPERIYNILGKPIERSTRITQADDEQGVSQSTRFGFAEREMIPIGATRGVPFSSVFPIDPQFAEPILSPASWISRSPLTAIARPFVLNRDDVLGAISGVAREFTPASVIHAWYALMGEPQRGMQPTLQHTRAERILRALGFNIQPLDAMRIAQQQQRTQQQQQREQLRFDPASIADIVKQILRRFGM